MLHDDDRIEARRLGLIDAAVIASKFWIKTEFDEFIFFSKLVGIVLLNILPCKYFDRYDTTKKITVKIGLGMFFSFISMIAAGGVELTRQSRSYCTSGNLIQ